MSDNNLIYGILNCFEWVMFSANGFVEIRRINTNAQLSVRCKYNNHGINLCCRFLLLNDNPCLLYAIKFLLDFDMESFSLIQSYLISPLQS